MSLEELLMWLSGDGVNAVWGVAYSLLLELWPGFQGRDRRVKRLVAMVGCLAIPVSAAAMRIALFGAADPADLIAMAIKAGLAAYFANQATHIMVGMSGGRDAVG
ncbi:MAG: hypothetical protein Kow0047_15830 [Anaerolineae bacterium]